MLTSKETVGAGFALISRDKYENDVIFSPIELVDYFITQPNVVAAIQTGRETVDSARYWILEQFHPFFDHDMGTFEFRTREWYFRQKS